MADITPIAHIETPFAEKFGVPRQSGVADCSGRIVFAPAYRDPAALRGLEEFSHIWLIWQFDRALRQGWSPTVRPPRLGGNARMGVFATRSPFRPNGLGLSSVVLERIQWDTPEGPVLHVRGADLVSGTPIFDIKPYLAYTDSHPEAAGGFTAVRSCGWCAQSSCWRRCRRSSGRGCCPCWPTIRGRDIRTIPSGSTVWPTAGATSASAWRAMC